MATALLLVPTLAHADERASDKTAKSQPKAGEAAPAKAKARAPVTVQSSASPRYLFFKDAGQATSPTIVPYTLDLGSLGSFTPSLLDGQRVVRAPEIAVPSLTRSATQRQKTAQTSLTFTPSGKVPDRRSLALGLTTRAATEADKPYASPNTLEAASGQTVNMAVAVGYGGFSLEAGYLRSQSLVAPVVQGLDLGLSYAGRDWKTSLQVAGLDSANDPAPMSTFMPDRNYSVELGGAYAISSRFAVTGGVKYAITVPQQGLRLREEVEHSSAVYLGTAFKF